METVKISQSSMATVAFIGICILFLAIDTFWGYLKLRKFPGPRLASFSKAWIFFATLRSEIPFKTLDAFRQYGISPTFYLFRCF